MDDAHSRLPVVEPASSVHFLRPWLKSAKAGDRDALWKLEQKSTSFHWDLFYEIVPVLYYDDKPNASEGIELGSSGGRPRGRSISNRFLPTIRCMFQELDGERVLEKDVTLVLITGGSIQHLAELR